MIFFGNKRIAIPAISALSTVIYFVVFWRTNVANSIISAFEYHTKLVANGATDICHCHDLRDDKKNDLAVKEHQIVIEKKVIVSVTQACSSPSRSPTAVAAAQAPSPHSPSSEIAAVASPPAAPKHDYAIVMAFVLEYPLYIEALKITENYCQTNGYDLKILRENVMGDFYTKEAHLFTVISQELAKPEAERLKWLLWMDSDVIIMNQKIRLETFLPPEPLDQTHLILTEDRNGVNAGVFFIKVDKWSLQLLAEVIGFGNFNPDVDLKYHEQTAMVHLIRAPRHQPHFVIAPRHFFNVYPATGIENERPARAGDFLIHFAGLSLRLEMNDFLPLANSDQWQTPPDQLSSEIRMFWEDIISRRTDHMPNEMSNMVLEP